MPATTRRAKTKTTPTRRSAKRKPKKATPKVLIRTSERTSFKRCRQAWDWGYNERLKPIQERPALRFGTLVHKAMELRYPPGIKRGPRPAETFEKIYRAEQTKLEEEYPEMMRDAEGDWEEMLDIGVDMLEGYVELYGRDEDWKVLASEMTFQVPVLPPDWLIDRWELTKAQAKRPLFYYVGTIDGVWQNRMDGGVRVRDYKTTSGDPEAEGRNKGVLDEQTTAYWTWGVDWLISKKILKPREQQALDGMLFEFMRKAKRDARPQNAQGQYLNQDGSVSKKQPPKAFHRELVYRGETDRENARTRAVQEYIEMTAVREGRAAVYKSPGSSYPDMQCRACAFRDICELHEIGADWESLRDATMATWDPYDAHEIAEEGKR